MKVPDGLLVKSLGLVLETWDQIWPLHIKRGVSGLGVCVGVPSEFLSLDLRDCVLVAQLLQLSRPK